MNINKWDVRCVLVDPGSSSEVMYKNLYDKLKSLQEKIRLVNMPVFNFSGLPVRPIGIV